MNKINNTISKNAKRKKCNNSINLKHNMQTYKFNATNSPTFKFCLSSSKLKFKS